MRLAALRFRNGHFDRMEAILWIVDSLARWPGSGKLSCQHLNSQYPIREAIQLVCVRGSVHLRLWGHVGCTPGHLGEAGHVLVTSHQLAHAKVCDLGLPLLGQEDIVAGEVTVDDVIGVEVGKGQRHVVAEIDLGVEGKGRGGGSLFQQGSEAGVQQFHEKDRVPGAFFVGAEVLDDVGVFDGAKYLALVVKALNGPIARE